MWYIKGNYISNTAAHRGAIQASCYPMTLKTNCTTMVFEKFCITTRTMNDKYHVDFSGMSIDELNKFIDKMKDEDQTRALRITQSLYTLFLSYRG